MIGTLRKIYGFRDENVLRAMEKVPREEFVPENERKRAFKDEPLPIGYGQTISQPYMVAYMTSLLELDASKKVLEVGTGSGYQAAILAELAGEVYSLEIIEELAKEASERLGRLGYGRVKVKHSDGYWGWREEGPFEAIMVTAAASAVPEPLVEQLKAGGKMCIPIGSEYGVQDLILIEKDLEGKVRKKSKMSVRFVPLTREIKR